MTIGLLSTLLELQIDNNSFLLVNKSSNMINVLIMNETEIIYHLIVLRFFTYIRLYFIVA